METVILSGQSLVDIALQECGSVEGVFALALANEISLTAMLTAGNNLLLVNVATPTVTNYYSVRSLRPATDITDSSVKLGGVGYMGVDIDFIVS